MSEGIKKVLQEGMLGGKLPTLERHLIDKAMSAPKIGVCQKCGQDLIQERGKWFCYNQDCLSDEGANDE